MNKNNTWNKKMVNISQNAQTKARLATHYWLKGMIISYVCRLVGEAMQAGGWSSIKKDSNL